MPFVSAQRLSKQSVEYRIQDAQGDSSPGAAERLRGAYIKLNKYNKIVFESLNCKMEPFELLTRDVLILLTYLFTYTATKLTLVINESTGEEVAYSTLTDNGFGK